MVTVMDINNVGANSPTHQDTAVELIAYSTKRRLTPNGRLQYHCPLDLGTRNDSNGVLTPVCYYDGDDISDTVIALWNGTLTIQKPPNPERPDDFSFSILIRSGIDENDFSFEGSLTDTEGEGGWEGSFAGRRTQRFDTPGGEIYGPDGRSTLGELLSYPSMSLQGTNPAQEEGSRILQRIVQASLPEDVKQTLQLNIPCLGEEEENIRRLAPDFLPRAAVVTLFKQWRNSEYVDKKERDKIDPVRCNNFHPACAANKTPPGKNENDPVKAFGWDRKKDAAIIEKVQGQYRLVSLACYRLGYRRAVTQFHPFLDHPLYWYQRLAEYLASPAHHERFRLRVLARDSRVTSDLQDWYTQLVLLKEAAENQTGGAPDIDEVINGLEGVALLASANAVTLDAHFIASLNEFFDGIERLKKDSEEYVQLNKLLRMEQKLAWGANRRGLLQVLQRLRSSCGHIPTLGEFWRHISSTRCLGLPMNIVAPIFATVCMGILLDSLLTGGKQLPLSEKITMCLSLAPMGVATRITGVWDLAKGLGAYITNLLPSCWGRALSIVIMTTTVALSEFRMTFAFALGVVVAGLCVWGAYDRLRQVWKRGKTIDKCEVACDLILSTLFFISTIYEAGVGLLYGGGCVMAWCGILGGGIAATAFMSTLVFAVVKHLSKDPLAHLITKYGDAYGLLKK